MTQISVVIPAYNVEKYISNTLQSLLCQNNKQFEIIVVNDGSTDKTLEVVNNTFNCSGFDNYQIISIENSGVSVARNVGLQKTKGDYILFLDGDDYVSDNMINEIYDNIRNDDPDIIAWKFDKVNERKHVLSKFEYELTEEIETKSGNEILKRIIFDESFWIWTCSVAYKKSLILDNHLWYSVDCLNGEDIEFIFKTVSCANKIRIIDKTLSFYV